jgi:esterase/lipase superfamily enzyme
MQRQYDAYIRHEVIPFIRDHCQSADVPGCGRWGRRSAAYHAANTLFKYPDIVKRCFALSGVYDMKGFMDGAYDENFYFNNPVDYLANASDPWMLGHLSTCDIHIATGSGPWEQSGESYRLSRVLASRGIHPSSRRLGSARRARLAVLETSDAGVLEIIGELVSW